MLPSKVNQMKASQEAGSEANIGFERALSSYLERCPLRAAWKMLNTMHHTMSFRKQSHFCESALLNSLFRASSKHDSAICG